MSRLTAKTYVQARVYQNTNNEITGFMGQEALFHIIDEALFPEDHVALGGIAQHPLGNGTTPGFSDNNYSNSDKTIVTGLSGHIGVGGIAQHPLGNGTTPGFSMNDFTTTIKNKIDSINVVQTTGQSTTDVMSQKAVTDALGAAGNGDMLKSVYDTNDNGKVDGAEAADKLSTSRSFTLTGDVTGTTNSDLSSNLSIGATLANSGVTAGTYTSVTVDAKGRVTAGTTPSLVMHSTSHELPNGVLSVWIGTMAQWSVIGSGNYNPAILYLVKP